MSDMEDTQIVWKRENGGYRFWVISKKPSEISAGNILRTEFIGDYNFHGLLKRMYESGQNYKTTKYIEWPNCP